MRGRIAKRNSDKCEKVSHRKIVGRDFEVEAGLPEMPLHMSKIARREWRQIAPELVEAGRLSVLDGKALCAYCEAYAKAEAASKLIDKFGMLVPVRVLEKGKLVTTDKLRANPAVAILKDYLGVLATYLDMFGLSPKSRLRLGVPAEKPKSRLQELMDDARPVGFLN